MLSLARGFMFLYFAIWLKGTYLERAVEMNEEVKLIFEVK